MKKLAIPMLLAVLALCLFPLLAHAQKTEKAVLRYDSTTKVLTRVRFVEVSEVIDTAKLYQQKARLIADLAKTNLAIDSVNAQIKAARKLMTGKKGNGNNKKPKEAEAPPVIVVPTTPKPTTTKTKKDGKN